MAENIIQRTDLPVAASTIKDDRTGTTVALFPANADVTTTWHGVITQTSPGVLTGIAGDTSNFIPGGAIPSRFRIYNPLVASTGATITVGIDTTSTYFLNAFAVSTLAAGQGQLIPQTVANLFVALANMPVGQAHQVTGFYAQTATAVGGGPFFVEIDYYLP